MEIAANNEDREADDDDGAMVVLLNLDARSLEDSVGNENCQNFGLTSVIQSRSYQFGKCNEVGTHEFQSLLFFFFNLFLKTIS